MADNPEFRDKSLEALDFVIKILREHEQKLDKAIEQLPDIIDQMGNVEVLNARLDRITEKVEKLHEQVRILSYSIYNGNKPFDSHVDKALIARK